MSVHIEYNNVTVRYGDDIALDDIDLEIQEKEVFSIVGPANSGKTTFLKCINRTIDLITGTSVDGKILVSGEDVAEMSNVYALRRRIGMVFPLPVGLPMSIYDNVA
ncbi:MAG: ATP-binding cassette domain-containing protein, partial [Verrucomicrobiales bacterium]|nr:ATP-binding cassette domain-containing protein [Verrucomicrobiales bacterium]